MKENIVSQLFPTREKGIFLPWEATDVTQFSIFAFIRKRKPCPVLTIKAIHNREEENIELIYMPDYMYRAEVPNIGVFYFSVENPKDIYSLNEHGEKVLLSILTPINTEFFEEACRKYRFFFVG